MLQQLMEKFPGISLACLDAQGNIHTECYGLADRESNVPVTVETLFPACSISKFITALCVMKLHQQGAIHIDAPANRFLHGWKLLSADGSESDATIRSLMNHTSGILDGEEGFYGHRRSHPEITLTDILEGRTAYNPRPARCHRPGGEAFEYSDAGYCVLQQLLEEVTGKDFDGLVRELIFSPLGLDNAFFATRSNLDFYENRLPMAAGYCDDGTLLAGKYLPCPDQAASGLWLSPMALLTIAGQFLGALRGGGCLLKQSSAREMALPAERFPWTGLGLFREGEDMLLSKGWGENGQCMLRMNRATGEIAVVMTNLSPDAPQEESGVEWLAKRPFS